MEKDNIKETSIEVKHWQWIKGDDAGLVVTIKEEGPKWITFDNGSRLATELKSEFLQELDDDIAGEFVKPQTPNIDPLNISAPSINTEKITGDVPISALDAVPSPIRVLFNKQKKNNKVKLLLEFPVNIPQKAVYELMSTSFDKDEVNDVLQSFILDQLSEDEILGCLHNSVQSLIESKYKGE